MKILITGSQGQLARELQLELAGDGQVLALGHDQLDLTDFDRIRTQVRQLQPDLIINAAAYTAVDAAESEPERAFALNAAAPAVLAQEADRLGVPLIHYSTDYVFDGSKPAPYGETDNPNPLSAYGRSKLAGERAVQAVGGQALILRTSWVYSLHGRNFLLTMQRLLEEVERLRVVDDEIGAPTWAGTIAMTTAHCIRCWRDGGPELHGLFHLTATGCTSWYGFAKAIADDLAQRNLRHALLEPTRSADYPTAAQRPLNSRLDCSRLMNRWQIQLPHWQEAFAQCLANRPTTSAPLASHAVRTA